jgi:hypothetical protein
MQNEKKKDGTQFLSQTVSQSERDRDRERDRKFAILLPLHQRQKHFCEKPKKNDKQTKQTNGELE